MRTIAICILLITTAVADDEDRFTLPRSQLDDVLNRERDEKRKKLQVESDELATVLAESSKAKPKQGKNSKVASRWVGEFRVPLSDSDLPKAKNHLKEMQTELAKLNKPPEIPKIDIAELTNPIKRLPAASGFLVEYVMNEAGERVAKPVVLTVQSLKGEDTVVARHVSGKLIFIKADVTRYRVGKTITLDMPIAVHFRGSDGIAVANFITLYEK